MVARLNNSINEFKSLDDTNANFLEREVCLNNMDVWRALEAGWIKIDIDATFKYGLATVGMVAHDCQGKLCYLAFSHFACKYARLAEVMALHYVMKIELPRSFIIYTCLHVNIVS